ncbi:HpcH/HpaI aldolase family protein [Kallipyga massiliensis]|uniref:HpcH/HpaI aldolase family protein n=1 Tax=Kallipyga massiliensis TaxID=1472764 RepID=UPI0004B3B34D|nr:aldolase/citrate lyase family protein [Kallipyga massiliensis]
MGNLSLNNIVLGTMISEFSEPNLIRIFSKGGYNFVIIDGEHGPFSSDQLSTMISLGKCINFPIIVRAPGLDRGFLTRTLDMGASGFLMPMVNTAEQAAKIVQYVKYKPIGSRGLSLTRSHTDYCPPDLKSYMKEANNKTLLLAQIETMEAVKNAEQIASVPGIDALVIGPSDLSSDLGDPGNLSNPKLLSCVKQVANIARKHNIVSGTVSGNMEYLHKCHDEGMNFFCVGSELSMLIKSAKNNVKTFYNEFS